MVKTGYKRIGDLSLTHECKLVYSGASARDSEAPWVRKNGNSSSRENLVMTSAYERPSERTPSVQTLVEEEGRLEVSLTGGLKKFHLFWRGLSEICIRLVSQRSGTLI